MNERKFFAAGIATVAAVSLLSAFATDTSALSGVGKKDETTTVTTVEAEEETTAEETQASASDNENVIDFEDGNFSFATMKTDDGGDNSKLSVVDFNGSKQLKVEVSDCANVPKLNFAINNMLASDDFDKVKCIEMDVTLESQDGTTPPGWAGGAIGTQGGDTKTPGWAQTAWEGGEYDKAVSEPMTIQRKFLLPREKFVDGTADTHMILMRWGCEVDYNMYVDNIKFIDEDGKTIPLMVTRNTAAEKQDEASVSQTAETESAEKTESKPEGDDKTTPATTGNATAAAAATAVVISGYAVAMTRKKK